MRKLLKKPNYTYNHSYAPVGVTEALHKVAIKIIQTLMYYAVKPYCIHAVKYRANFTNYFKPFQLSA